MSARDLPTEPSAPPARQLRAWRTNEDLFSCDRCGATMARADHKCPAPWLIWEAAAGMTEADAAPIYVDDVESAAERFCSDHDSDGDYGIIRSGKATLKARRAGQTFTVEIEAETVPEYRASVAAEPDPETTAEEEPS